MLKSFISTLVLSLKQAVASNHRRLVVLSGSRDDKLIDGVARVLEAYLGEVVRRREVSVLYAYHAFYGDGVRRRGLFEEAVEELGDRLDVDFVPYHESVRAMGATYDVAILDLINNLEPNDLGKLVGVVRGGGVLIFVTPPLDRWESVVTRFQELLLTHKYGVESLRRIFVRRFIRKLMEHDGIAIYDVDRDKVIKLPRILEEVRYFEGRRIVIPEKTIFPKRVYELALTQDQVNVLRIMERLYEKVERDRKLNIVITADRGRGKSCAVGIGIATLAHKLRRSKGRARIIVTAPSETNVQSLFQLAAKALRVLRHDVEVEERGGLITGLSSKGIEITYLTPLESVRRGADIVAVDEAAGLQVPMLYAIHRNFSKAVFSSTIHGYEGAGRGFSVRFLGLLRRDPNTTVIEYEMEEPIRYANDDPIEEWLFDTLLLDAEPAQLDERDLKLIEEMRVEYYVPDLEEFFLKREEELRQFVGIYIMAHYRNNSNDLGMMMDAPHHTVRALRLPTGKIVTSIELAEEGDIPREMAVELAKGAWIAGNIIPDRYIKHYRVLEFGEFTGWRIVRIATHPSVMRRGLGSYALRKVEEEAVERGYDWVGAGFGVNRELLRFWLKNGYMPIHISPDRNPVSGEYTVIVVKPLNERIREYVVRANREFRIKLVNSLHEPYHDLDIHVARMLLTCVPDAVIDGYKPNLTDIQVGRVLSYAWGQMTVENCMDAVTELARTYFYRAADDRPKLSEMEELILIVRVLQAKSWKVTCQQLRVSPPQVMSELRSIVRKLAAHFLGLSEEDFGTYFVRI